MNKNQLDKTLGTIKNYISSNYAAKSHTHNYAGSSSAGGAANRAAKLQTARTINGTSFDGSANITTANWGTARTLTIGGTGKSVNGSGNVSWSLSEIGAAASSHTHTSFTNVTNVNFKTAPTDVASIRTTLFTDGNKEITNLDFYLGDNPAQYEPTDEGYATCDRFRWRFKPIDTSNYSEFSIMEAFAKEIDNKLKGELLINGDLYCTDGKNSVSIGVGTGSKDVYMYNQKANKFLQICDDGTLRYSGLKLYHEGNRPYPLDIGALPVSGGTMTGDLNISAGFYLKSWRPDGVNINLIGISQHGVVDVGNENSSIALLSHDLPKYWDGSTLYEIITGKGGQLENGVNFAGQSALMHANNGIMLYDKNYDKNMSILFQNDLMNFYSTTSGFRFNQTIRIEGNLYPVSPGKHWVGDEESPFWGMRTVGGGFSQVSDRTYKEDIRDIDDSVFIDMIKNTKVHSYLYKESTSSDVQTLNIKPQRTQESVDKDLLNIGILAQELAENEGSEYILNKGESGIYSLSLYNFSSAIMSALRHEISKREAAEERIVVLEKENQELKDRLAKIEAYLGL